MNFRMADLERIATGEITLAFRRWKRPSVRAGGTLTTAVGVLAIDAVECVDPERISNDEAARAGYTDRAELRAALQRQGAGDVYRIAVRLGGRDPRIALRTVLPDAAALRDLETRLARMDRAASNGPWTLRTLRLLAVSDGTRAADLATRLELDRDALKRNVRKLKNLGLTESLEVGYRLSPRGRALLRHLGGV